MTGEQIVIEALKQENVNVVFGRPGEDLQDIYRALYKSSKIRHVLMRHEQCVVHAADGYARATGKIGVCLIGSRAGASSAITGIATAYRDSVPLLILTSQGIDIDIIGMTQPCTKHNFLVRTIEDLTQILKAAFYIARNGRPGPVLIAISPGVLQEDTTFSWSQDLKIPHKPVIEPDSSCVAEAYLLLESCSRPVMLVGRGAICSEASPEVRELAEKLNLPVAMTLLGLGAFPAIHPLSLGMPGMFGNYYANMALSNSDLILSVGARFDDRVTGRPDLFAPKAKIIHIDIDPVSIGKTVRVDVPILGDCKRALRRLLDIVTEKGVPRAVWRERFNEWWQQIEIWKQKHPLTYEKDNKSIRPQSVIEKLYELTQGETIVATEVGQNQLWAAHYYKFNFPKSFITSGGLGTMGFGLPAAIGAQIGCPDKVVVDIAGDGSLQMTLKEMATALDQGLPLKIIVFNNGYLGLVKQWQKLFYGERYCGVRFATMPDFVKLAKAYGAEGLRISKPEEIEPILKKALQNNVLTVIDVLISPEESIFPVIPMGAPLTEMLFQDH